MLLYITSYILSILAGLSAWINKSRSLSTYIFIVLSCDLAGILRQTFTHYPKPYQGTGFILFAVTTSLFFLIPASTWLASVWSFTKMVFYPVILFWLTVAFGCLFLYPQLRGDNLLRVFYTYYLTLMIPLLIYFLSKFKHKFTFTQSALFLATLGSLVTTLIAIIEVKINATTFQVESWELITICNCIFYGGIIVWSWLNHFAKWQAP